MDGVFYKVHFSYMSQVLMYDWRMHTQHEHVFERVDIWREGKWLDLWSVVHFLSGTSVGFALYFVRFGAPASTLLAFVSFTAYEMWEAMVGIEEAPTNRFMDVVVGMASFLPTFFLLAPVLSGMLFWKVFGLVFVANIVTAVFGWVASQKAAELEKRLRIKYVREKSRIRGRTEKIRGKFKKSED